MQFQIESIGIVHAKKGFAIRLDSKWRHGLAGLQGFGHVIVLWQAHQASPQDALVTLARPYVGGPDEVGVFASRTPARPNGICLSVAALVGVDLESSTLHLAWIDSEDGSPVIDIKPYHPSADRVDRPRTPAWCASWPKSLEESAHFDWSRVFSP